MKLALTAAAALLTLTGAAALAVGASDADAADAQADANAPCERLIDQARHLPDAAWAKGVKALEPSLTINTRPGPPTAFEATLAQMPEVKKRLYDEDGSWTISVDRLPGTDIYVASDYQGTLHCQGSVFLNAPQGADAKIIDPPPGWSDGDVCWTQSADAGRVFGQPAFIAHGAVSQTTDDERIGITPWIGTSWGARCTVGLDFRRVFKRKQAYCGDRIACAAADMIAVAVAEAYNRWPDKARETGGFWYGPKPSDAALDAVKRFVDPKQTTQTMDFPTFGATDHRGFSYSGFALFPVTLDGRAYVAAIGHDGVGWRESSDTLLAIYKSDGAALTPLAGFVIGRSLGGLQSAALEAPKPLPALLPPSQPPKPPYQQAGG